MIRLYLLDISRMSIPFEKSFPLTVLNVVYPNVAPCAPSSSAMNLLSQIRFEIGSITKQITAAAIMQLVENQKLSVNDTLEKYFPSFPYKKDITKKINKSRI